MDHSKSHEAFTLLHARLIRQQQLITPVAVSERSIVAKIHDDQNEEKTQTNIIHVTVLGATLTFFDTSDHIWVNGRPSLLQLLMPERGDLSPPIDFIEVMGRVERLKKFLRDGLLVGGNRISACKCVAELTVTEILQDFTQ